MVDKVDKELQRVIRAGEKERKRELDQAISLWSAIMQLSMVEQTDADPNGLLRVLRLQEFPDWEAHLLDAKSLLGRVRIE